MILQRSQQRLAHHPDVEQLKLKLQTEYEQLITRLNQFYNLKKKLFDDRKNLILQEYDQMTLKSQLKELNFIFKQQKIAWLKLANAYTQST
jgi:stearoyl-CoA desaturase (delta-9 desaturase)